MDNCNTCDFDERQTDIVTDINGLGGLNRTRKELTDGGWTIEDNGAVYKHISDNGKWEILKFLGDAAFYSWCSSCGYLHSCCKDKRENGVWMGLEYNPDKEFNYCPTCGDNMLLDKNEVIE